MKKQIKIESPNELLELAIGYQRSQVLFTLVELEIPKLLDNAELNAADVARRLDIHPLAMERFLNACVAIGLLEIKAEIYKNTSLTSYFLVAGNQFYLGGQIKRYQNRSYSLWKNLKENLRNWKYGKNNFEPPDEEDQGAESMVEQHNLALLHGFALAKKFDFSNYHHLLDLGGGTGAMAIGLCESLPNLKATVFDLNETIEKADKYIERCNLKSRIETIGGDIVKDELPKDFDVVLLANLLSVFDADTNKKLLSQIYEKLPKNGVCIISGWILDESRLSPETAVLFCLEDINWQSPDVERSFAVYNSWLEQAGFKDINYQTYLEPTSIIYGFKK